MDYDKLTAMVNRIMDVVDEEFTALDDDELELMIPVLENIVANVLLGAFDGKDKQQKILLHVTEHVLMALNTYHDTDPRKTIN